MAGSQGAGSFPQGILSLSEGEDFAPVTMGNFYVDRYLCSAPDATAESRGSMADTYVSRAGVAPMVDQTISVFKERLTRRFDGGGFDNGPSGVEGLLPDAYWNQIWIYARLSGCTFHGNTDCGRYHGQPEETGARDLTTAHGTLTGAGPASWQEPLSDFTGNRAEFTDGLRLFDGMVYSAGLAIDPPADVFAAPYKSTGVRIEGVEPYHSVIEYRSEESVRFHGIGRNGGPPELAAWPGRVFSSISGGNALRIVGAVGLCVSLPRGS